MIYFIFYLKQYSKFRFDKTIACISKMFSKKRKERGGIQLQKCHISSSGFYTIDFSLWNIFKWVQNLSQDFDFLYWKRDESFHSPLHTQMILRPMPIFPICVNSLCKPRYQKIQCFFCSILTGLYSIWHKRDRKASANVDSVPYLIAKWCKKHGFVMIIQKT